jgi:hypothetical protein
MEERGGAGVGAGEWVRVRCTVGDAGEVSVMAANL